MNDVRDKILASIRQRMQQNKTKYIKPQSQTSSQKAKLAMFSDKIKDAHAEVHWLKIQELADWLSHQLITREYKNVLLGCDELGNSLKKNLSKELQVEQYSKSVEACKDDLFNKYQVGITGSLGAIAQTGSLVIVPSKQEPRLLSLLPEVHIAILHESNIYQNFKQVIKQNNWQDGMPSNVVLISGPSKTADIEQILAYGVHGPKKLIVIIIANENNNNSQ